MWWTATGAEAWDDSIKLNQTIKFAFHKVTNVIIDILQIVDFTIMWQTDYHLSILMRI